MAKPKFVVFVVGAGASKAFNPAFPTGAELWPQIVTALEKDFGGAEPSLQGPISGIVGKGRTVLPPDVVDAASQIRFAAAHYDSIDDFLHDWREKPMLTFVAKMAIALSIAKAERESPMNGVPPWAEPIKRAITLLAPNTWLGYALKHIRPPDVPVRQIDDYLGRMAFIVFNYDRCVEHFLNWAICNIAHVDPLTARGMFRKLKIVHPYGLLAGVDIGGERDASYLGFGAPDAQLARLAEGIRTYTEDLSDKTISPQIAELFEKASDVVFLGFGYHPQNLDLLFAGGAPNCNVWGTSFQLSDERRSDLRKRIRLHRAGTGPHFILDDSECLEFLKEHRSGIFD